MNTIITSIFPTIITIITTGRLQKPIASNYSRKRPHANTKGSEFKVQVSILSPPSTQKLGFRGGLDYLSFRTPASGCGVLRVEGFGGD